MKSIIAKLSCTMCIVMMLTLVLNSFELVAQAKKQTIEIDGLVYQFGKSSEYKIDSSQPKDNVNKKLRIGTLSINGDIKKSYDKSGIAAFEIADDKVFTLDFNYKDTLKKAGENSWHLIEDDGDTVNGIELSNDIGYGALILQTSLDGKKWVTNKTFVNFKGDKSFGKKQINNVQLANGCYYRIIAAFEAEKRTKDYSWSFDEFYKIDDYSTQKIAQVYEFYASYKDTDSTPIGEKYYFYAGAKNAAYTVGTETNNYAGSQTITKDDPHYGWDLGYFCLSGYTDKGDSDNVYLKKVGNKVKLTFHLDQNIKKLNGNSDLKITNDKNGSDEKFKIPSHNMKHGELIIRHTDSENVTEEVKYSDYLAALASPGADTSIQLFEEGDYEVHLDYSITDYDGWDSTTYYRTSFKFKIRNANCMVYIFDSKSGDELNNGDVTANGFRIDTARSSYPKLQVTKEILNDTESGLVEDTRFNGAASDGETFTDEGIYTIKAFNRYDDKLEPAVKTIYVGRNNILTAYTKNLNSSKHYEISELNTLVDKGYTITDDGDIIGPSDEDMTDPSDPSQAESIAAIVVKDETSSKSTTETAIEPDVTKPKAITSASAFKNDEETNSVFPVLGGVAGAAALIGAGAAVIKKKKKDE